MTGLLAAINTYFSNASSGPLSDTITGGLHLAIAPPDAALPHCVYSVVGGDPTHKYGAASPAFEECQIQFTVRAAGAAASLDLLENGTTGLMKKFDGVVLTISGKQNFYSQRIGVPIPEPADPTQDEQGDDTFGWIITYLFAATI